MRASESDIETGGIIRSRALAIEAPGVRMTASRQSAWVLRYPRPHPVRRADDSPASGGFKFPGRLSMAIGDVVEMLVATSGTLVVVIILLAMAMLMRGIRTLLRR